MRKIKILFVCHGNICRSTMCQYVLQHMVNMQGMKDQFYIDSAATSREEIGNGVHWGTRDKLKREGIPCGNHRARQMTRKDYEEFDYIIGMDTANMRNINRITGGDPDGKVYKLLALTDNPADVADPWYTGDFEATYRDVVNGCSALMDMLKEKGYRSR